MARATRFTTWRKRGDQRELIYESLDWVDPLVLEYNSITDNLASDRDAGIEGGMSGVVDLQQGDVLEWECHVINERSTTLRFTNETYDGEMCILVGEMVGTVCSPF